MKELGSEKVEEALNIKSTTNSADSTWINEFDDEEESSMSNLDDGIADEEMSHPFLRLGYLFVPDQFDLFPCDTRVEPLINLKFILAHICAS